MTNAFFYVILALSIMYLTHWYYVNESEDYS